MYAIIDDNGFILCPHCESSYLHIETTQQYGSEGIKIVFFCEGCHGKPVLHTTQHKGHTVFEWW
jgi:hypothetical protein